MLRAADWNLNEPQWTGRMRLVYKDSECVLKLEDKNSGELFAKCPIDKYPGVAIEPVSDSSRYFVLRIQDDNGKFYIFILVRFDLSLESSVIIPNASVYALRGLSTGS